MTFSRSLSLFCHFTSIFSSQHSSHSTLTTPILSFFHRINRKSFQRFFALTPWPEPETFAAFSILNTLLFFVQFDYYNANFLNKYDTMLENGTLVKKLKPDHKEMVFDESSDMFQSTPINWTLSTLQVPLNIYKKGTSDMVFSGKRIIWNHFEWRTSIHQIKILTWQRSDFSSKHTQICHSFLRISFQHDTFVHKCIN